MFTAPYAAPFGELTLVASDAGLRAVLWPAEKPGRVRLPETTSSTNHPILVSTVTQLHEYFAGTRRRFDLPLDLRGTVFQVKAWRALADIPYGQTTSYAQQAAHIGHPTAVRAVGSANGRNPISIVLPCHRVVATSGALTGFAGGLDIKRWLLDFESTRLATS
jgi:methylated-DNA-[protein]-cysteine S-methyltransferase